MLFTMLLILATGILKLLGIKLEVIHGLNVVSQLTCRESDLML
jgi:hypothetical protein